MKTITIRRIDPGLDRMIKSRAKQNNLRNISLRIPHDTVTAVTGVSGSGKSTMLNILGCLISQLTVNTD
jgi:excinuclease UvrABC ATPase subunit